MTAKISCCINNLIQHQYGAQLNELAADGVEISLERCLHQCVGCKLHPAFETGGKWYGLEPDADFKKEVYAKARQIG